ncbi:MAG TPA: hypothetical protein VFZ61_34525 [Polyangiales bacterium]
MSAPEFWFRPQRPASRLGLKGADAPRLLQQAGIDLPEVANAIHRGAGGDDLSRCLRLGSTEFLLEQDDGGGIIEHVRVLAAGASLRAWPVLRADYCVLLGGRALSERLSHIASFDFESLLDAPDRVVMTLAAEISVTLALDSADTTDPRLRLWADVSFGTYLEQTLQTLSRTPASRHGDPA